jgi:hypothetical protein
VPVEGTNLAEHFVAAAPRPRVEVDELVDELEGIRADLAALSPTLAAAELALRRRIEQIGEDHAA